MKKFNVSRTFDNVLEKMRLPINALYGKDESGLWVCAHKSVLENSGIFPALRLYRYDSQGWSIVVEKSNTTAFIYNTALKYHVWETPIKWPGRERREMYAGLDYVLANMDKTGTRKKSQALKGGNRNYETRHNAGQIKLDFVEKVISRTF